MIKKLFQCILLLGFMTTAYAQVGINTQTPVVTLDVVGKPDVADHADGFIAPRLTLNQLKAKDSLYVAAQTGALVYITATATPTSAKTIGVTTPGYYYYNGAPDTERWEKVANPSAARDTSDDAWINATGNVRLITLADGTTPRTNANNFFILDNGNVGIGSASPTSKLQVVGLPDFATVADAQASTTISAGAFYRLNVGSANVQSTVRVKY